MLPVSVIVLSHNRIDEIQKNLPPLAEQTHQIELVVVDNASTDGSREFLSHLKQKYPEMILVLSDNNLNVAGGRNTGFSKTLREFIVALDDDTSITIDTLKTVPEAFDRYPHAGILAFKVCHATTGELQNNLGDQPIAVANFHGAAFAIRKDLFDRIGNLDELCSFGAEEFDFSVRAHAAGYETIYLPEVIVYHNSFQRPGSAGADRREKWIYNYVRVLYKHFPRKFAGLYSARFLFNAMRSGKIVYGFSFAVGLMRYAYRGRRDGISMHAELPNRTIHFYANSGLRP